METIEASPPKADKAIEEIHEGRAKGNGPALPDLILESHGNDCEGNGSRRRYRNDKSGQYSCDEINDHWIF
jgi:hypothetical protein